MTAAPSTGGWTRRVRLFVADLPRDLLAVLAVVLLGNAIFVTTPAEPTPPRVLAGFAFVLVVPGYALVSALFPEPPRGALARPSKSVSYSPGTSERLALGFGASLALVPMLSVSHGLLEIPFTPSATVGSVSAVTVAFTIVAIARRRSRPPARRYAAPSIVARLRSLRDSARAQPRVDVLLNVALAVAVLLALGSVGFAVSAPHEEQSYTSASLVTQGDTAVDGDETTGDDEFVASGYPTNLTQGESEELTVRVENRHDEAADYTVVTELQRVSEPGTAAATVQERAELQRLQSTVDGNDTWHHQHEVTPTFSGDDLRLQYYVYRGETPDDPSAATADRTLHLWVSVASVATDDGENATNDGESATDDETDAVGEGADA